MRGWVVTSSSGFCFEVNIDKEDTSTLLNVEEFALFLDKFLVVSSLVVMFYFFFSWSIPVGPNREFVTTELTEG